ncbi:MAG: hypothetical protein HPY85_08970 [Anaerolineae bacterium]|jgi:hypothetical protein|nr:hypothetical protein [Anaerolineae bacterium]
MEDEKKLKLMRFWLFGTFVIIFAAATIYVGQFTGMAIFKEWRYWLSMAIAAALCVGAFFGYKAFISRK